MIYLFLDTNIFIHFKNFEDIPWNQILECNKNDIEITIAPIVIDELDKHKYNSNPKVANRIKKLMPKFNEILSTGNSKGFKVQFLDKRPHNEIFDEYMLDKSQQDDCLLASILSFKNQLENNEKVFYVTNDFGPRIKTKSLNIDLLSISEEYLMENDSSEEQKLKKENERLKNLFPKLDFFFKESQDKIYEVKKEKYNLDKSIFITKKMEEIKKESPILIYTDNSNNSFLKYNSLTEEQVINYNADLKAYFDGFEKYWDVAFDSAIYHHNFLKIDLLIKNIGNLPANDIDIVLHFPSDINILFEEDLDQFHLFKPKPPYKPETSFDIIYTKLNRYHVTKSSISKNKPITRNEVEFNFKGLKHNKTIELDTLFIPSDNLIKGFKIDYSILVSNIPNSIKGELNVIFFNLPS
ncbi:UNVERIFIED_CONTAM: PIN domain-containing protein [Ralstonia mannitolilytica]